MIKIRATSVEDGEPLLLYLSDNFGVYVETVEIGLQKVYRTVIAEGVHSWKVKESLEDIEIQVDKQLKRG